MIDSIIIFLSITDIVVIIIIISSFAIAIYFMIIIISVYEERAAWFLYLKICYFR